MMVKKMQCYIRGISMEYNGVQVHFKNGKTINIKMSEPNKFIDWVTELDLSKMQFISIDDKEAINLTEVLHIKACKIAELKKTHNGK